MQSEDESSEEEENEEGEQLSDVDVDFDFCDPAETDYHGIGELLKSGTWDFMDPIYAEMQDAIAGQGNIGTLVKSDVGGETEAVCGMLTVLNMRQFPKHKWPQAIAKSLIAKAKKHATAEVVKSLEALLDGEKKKGREVGLLLTERFANLPLELVPPLHKALAEDIEWSCTTPECPEDERPFYRFSHFLGLARCYDTGEAAAPRKKKKRAAAAASQPSTGSGGTYMRPEDGAYVKKASFSFSFPVGTAGGGGEGQLRRPERRMVFVISRAALQEVVTEVPLALADAA